MHNTANVYLWGTRVGTVLLQDESPIAKFQYADEFLDMGVEVSPREAVGVELTRI